MTPDEIAQEVFWELEDSSSVSVSGISYWLRSNIGRLNNVIYTNFNKPASGAGGFYQGVTSGTSDMTDKEKDIFKLIYEIKYYDYQIRSSLGAASLDPIVEISSDGAKVRKVSRNDIGKTWLSLRKDANDALTKRIFAYTYNESSPRDIYGDDISSADTVISYSNSYKNIVVQ